MEMMKAFVCKRYGPAEVLTLQLCKKPSIGSDEVLVKVYSTSVTNSDVFIRSSKVKTQMLIPFRIMIGILKPRKKILGQVFAGVIVNVGKNIRSFNIGDKVYGLTGFSLGAYAEFMKLKEVDSKKGCISIMPQNVSFEEATSAAYGGLLAMQFLEKRIIGKTSKVLVYGASSTSGLFALQYLKYLGAEVTCVCSESKFDFVKSLGADKVLDYTNNESISKLEFYDIVFDCVGKAKQSLLRNACLHHLNNKGDFISIDDEALLLSSDRLQTIKNLVEKNGIKPINDRVYNFEQMIDAHKYVELGHKTGNVAVKVNSVSPMVSV